MRLFAVRRLSTKLQLSDIVSFFGHNATLVLMQSTAKMRLLFCGLAIVGPPIVLGLEGGEDTEEAQPCF